jgi:hypothetical protein
MLAAANLLATAAALAVLLLAVSPGALLLAARPKVVRRDGFDLMALAAVWLIAAAILAGVTAAAVRAGLTA